MADEGIGDNRPLLESSSAALIETLKTDPPPADQDRRSGRPQSSPAARVLQKVLAILARGFYKLSTL